jgi:hypothetical protein
MFFFDIRILIAPLVSLSSMPTYISSILVLSDVVHTGKILGTSKEEFSGCKRLLKGYKKGAGTAYAFGTHEFTPGF